MGSPSSSLAPTQNCLFNDTTLSAYPLVSDSLFGDDSSWNAGNPDPSGIAAALLILGYPALGE